MIKRLQIDLINHITSLVEDENTPLWFPSLTDELANVGWRTLDNSCGLTVHSYSTARVASRNTKTARHFVAHILVYPGTADYRTTIPIEVLTRSFTDQYKDAGISFYTAEEIIHTSVLNSIQGAMEILDRVPTLTSTVATLIRSFHPLKPPDNEYDVSFSEPYIPFSIFVSVTQESNVEAKLRLAEAVVHEAMHLQLTLIERVVALVIPTQKKYFSPWRGEYRTPHGILHALYVFKVIDSFLKCLLSACADNIDVREYVVRRHDEIDEQTNRIQSFRSCSDLTVVGTSLVRRLI